METKKHGRAIGALKWLPSLLLLAAGAMLLLPEAQEAIRRLRKSEREA
jgi:hypothetical protein